MEGSRQTEKYTVQPNTLVNSGNNTIPPLILMFVKSAGNADHSFPKLQSFLGIKLLILTIRNLFVENRNM